MLTTMTMTRANWTLDSAVPSLLGIARMRGVGESGAMICHNPSIQWVEKEFYPNQSFNC